MSDLIHVMNETLGLRAVDIRSYSPLALAYIGDGVFDLIIRSFVINKGNVQVNKMHRHTSNIVKAQTQAQMVQALEPLLNTEEEGYYKRGRNAKSHTTAKNASVGDYRKATGFEALCGYLFLMDNMERVMQIVRQALEAAQVEL